MNAVDELARRHQVRCPACAGSGSSSSRAGCSACDGEGRIGNCADCGGRGVFHRYPLAAVGCTACQTKGWIGNCLSCRGVGILEAARGYKACITCDGYGHLETDLRPPERARFAVIARHSSEVRFLVPCSSVRLGFGRWGRPHMDVDVRLHDPLVSKLHFEILWDERAGTHLVRHLRPRNLPTVQGKPVGNAGHRLSVGDVIAIGDWALEYVKLVAG